MSVWRIGGSGEYCSRGEQNHQGHSMQQRREFIRRLSALGAVLPVAHATSRHSLDALPAAPVAGESRDEWVRLAVRLADPVLGALAAGRLRATMPVELAATATAERRDYAHLEAVGRLLAGIAPWLELGADATPEGAARARLAARLDETRGTRRGQTGRVRVGVDRLAFPHPAPAAPRRCVGATRASRPFFQFRPVS